MREFIFLPDLISGERDGVPLESTLKSINRKFGNLGVAKADRPAVAAAQSLGIKRSVLSRPMLTSSKTKQTARIVETVEHTGAALVVIDTDEDTAPTDIPGGSFHPVVSYAPAGKIKVKKGGRAITADVTQSLSNFLSVRFKIKGSGDFAKKTVVKLNLIPPSVDEEVDMEVVTNAYGRATFPIRGQQYVSPFFVIQPGFENHWGGIFIFDDIRSNDIVELDPIDLDNQPDTLRHMTNTVAGDGRGVKVGVIDSGVGPHIDIPNVSGDTDSSIGHGTHVAGIIAGNGPGKLKGLAPKAEIFSYRVFNDPGTGTTQNFEIYKAILKAVEDGCHLINLSLKIMYATEDGVVGQAIEYAKTKGVLCFAAAGNDYGAAVAFPASHPDCLAVSACGHIKGFPEGSYDGTTTKSNDVSAHDPELFFGKFSNQGINGSQVNFIAPGCGIVSTVLDNNYAPMSGTSMACPAAVGALCQHISNNPSILDMPQDASRYEALIDLAVTNASSIGLSSTMEGIGMISYGH